MRRFGQILLGLALVLAPARALATDALPPPTGPADPRVVPLKEDNGLYHQSWFQLSFLDLKEDFNEAKAEGKRFAVIFEQRGCPYCIKLHNEILALKYAQFTQRKRFESFIAADDHDAPHPIDYFVWVIRNPLRTIVVDTGFDAAEGAKRGRKGLQRRLGLRVIGPAMRNDCGYPP